MGSGGWGFVGFRPPWPLVELARALRGVWGALEDLGAALAAVVEWMAKTLASRVWKPANRP